MNAKGSKFDAGFTALTWEATNGHADVVELLVALLARMPPAGGGLAAPAAPPGDKQTFSSAEQLDL